MRIVAILAAYNEERFIAACLDHLIAQGVEVYLLNNDSIDRTVEIASQYLNRGLIAIERLPRENVFDLHTQMARKEELAKEIEADWFMHVDTDEFHVPPAGGTLKQALEDVDRQGYNAVNFLEFTFLPTREHAEHDHSRFRETMRWYYPFLPSFPHRLNAWRKQPERVALVSSGGHRVDFPGLKMFPRSFFMKHYIVLGLDHAIQKYVRLKFSEKALAAGWSKWRSQFTADMIRFPPEAELRTYISDDRLDASNPRTRHVLADVWAAQQKETPS